MQDDDDKDKKKRRDDSGPDSGGGGDDPENNNNKNKGVDFKSSRYVFLIIVLGVILAVVFGGRYPLMSTQTAPDWTTFRKDFAAGKFKEVHFEDNRNITALYADGQAGTDDKKRNQITLTAPVLLDGEQMLLAM